MVFERTLVININARNIVIMEEEKPPPKVPGRCSAPGHKKMRRQAQLVDIQSDDSLPEDTASRPTVFTIAGQQEVMNLFREINPDTETKVLERWAAHNRELRKPENRLE